MGRYPKADMLASSRVPTGELWGNQVADVIVSSLPVDMSCIPLLHEDDLRLVFFKTDRTGHLGWGKSFDVQLKFSDGSLASIEVPPSHRLKDEHSIDVHVRNSFGERSRQEGRLIPRNLFGLSAPLTKQPNDEIRSLLSHVRDLNAAIQCTCDYFVLEDDAGLKEIELSGIPGLKEAYNALLCGAYKADLLRYLLLYKYGGIYCDDKTVIPCSIDSDLFDGVLENCEFFIAYTGTEEPRRLFPSGTEEIAFMGSRPGHPVLLKILEESIKLIHNRDYTEHRLGITGNVLFNRIAKDDTTIKRLYMNPYSNNQVDIDGDILWKRQAIPNADWPKRPNGYATRWFNRQVFVDRNPEPREFDVIRHSETAKVTLSCFATAGILLIIAMGIKIYGSRFEW